MNKTNKTLRHRQKFGGYQKERGTCFILEPQPPTVSLSIDICYTRL